jgi:predicted nucleotidyltransferase
MKRFLTEWCSFRHGHPATHKCRPCEESVEQLHHAIVDNPRVRALAGNPLTLTILSLLHEAGGALPQRRWELYEKVTEAFLFSWEEKKRREACGALDRGLEVESREAVWVLESLAVEMQRRDLTLAPRWWLLAHVAGFLRDELSFDPNKAAAQADTLLGSLQKRSGLLAERAPERFGFSHLAFQEYFAARAVLSTDDPIEALRPYFYHPRWREVVRLAASQLDRHRVPQLFRAILDDPDPTGRFIHRGLLTTLACLADGASVHDPQLLRDLEGRIADLGKSPWLGIAIEALDFLAELIGTRLGEQVTKAAQRLVSNAEDALPPEDAIGLRLQAIGNGVLADSEGYLDGAEPEPTAETGAPLIREQRFSVGGHEFSITWVVSPRGYDPEWARATLNRVRDDPSPRVRSACADELGRLARHQEVRDGLLSALAVEKEPGVRRAIAGALGSAGSATEVVSALRAGLEADPALEVRSACARALADAARRDRSVRDILASVLRSQEPPAVRAGAVAGLSRCVPESREVRTLLLATLKDSREDDEVRSRCLGSLEEVLPSMPAELAFVEELLAGPPEAALTHCGARILATYVVSGRVKWGAIPVGKIEQALMSLTPPCCHILDALRGLVDARELRRLGIPREARIERALGEYRGRIRAMFIFGSSARDEQGPDSDIDLMVIGDVTLKELTPGLRKAEQELGRQVNVVIYSMEKWREQCQRKDPFVMNVLNHKTVFVAGDRDELRAVAG